MPLIYLDTCAVQRPLDARSQPRIRAEADAVTAILAAVVAGQVELATSVALRIEAARAVDPSRRRFAGRVLALARRDVVASGGLEAAARTFEALGLRALDALHLASAVEAGADVLCTADDRFLKRARAANTGATRVVTPLELAAALNL